MIYVVSDLHGCYDKYKALLDRLNLTENDSLYILGDIVDRGDGGMAFLLDLAKRKNIFSYRGNHDHCAQMLLRKFAIPIFVGRLWMLCRYIYAILLQVWRKSAVL